MNVRMQMRFHQCLSERAAVVLVDIDQEEAATAMVKKLTEQQGTTENELERRVIQLMQFIIAAEWMHRHHRNAELTAIGNWIGWSFSTKFEKNHEAIVDLSRLDVFTKHPLFSTWPELHSYLVMYLSSFYYYVRARTAMKNIAEAFWENAGIVFSQVMAAPESMQELDAFLGTSMLEWAAKESTDRARTFTAEIERAASTNSIPSNVRGIFLVSLSTNGGRFSATSREQWARIALDEGIVHQQLETQLHALLASTSDLPSVKQLFSNIEAVQSKRAESLPGTEFARSCGRTFDSLTPYFRRLVASGDVEEMVRLLRAWYIPMSDVKCLQPLGLLITVPALDFGLTIFTANQNEVVERNSQALVEAMVALENRFLGTAKTVAYGDNSALELPIRPGIPEIARIEGFEQLLIQYYCPIQFDFSEVKSQLVFPAEGRPVQAAQLLAWQMTWPIAASLAEPRADSHLRRAIIWTGAATLTEEMEATTVAALLARIDVHVEVIDGAESTADDFIKVYERNDIDLLWVISHGHFDHWNPHEVNLQVSHSGTTVSLEALWSRLPKRDLRRLLVLNVCDGGRFDEVGPIPRVGMAAGLADCSQATISHLWPVMPFPSAAFGACLATALASHLSFFDAFVKATSLLREGPQRVAELLDEACGEQLDLSRALKNRTDDMGSVQIWGSAVFYE
jgi:hypothetical protein